MFCFIRLSQLVDQSFDPPLRGEQVLNLIQYVSKQTHKPKQTNKNAPAAGVNIITIKLS